MKKVVKLIGTLGCVLLLCGCGSKKMSCTMDTDDEVMKSKVLMNVSFKNDGIDTIKIDSNYEIKDEYKDIVQTMKDSYDECASGDNEEIIDICCEEYILSTLNAYKDKIVAVIYENDKDEDN